MSEVLCRCWWHLSYSKATLTDSRFSLDIFLFHWDGVRGTRAPIQVASSLEPGSGSISRSNGAFFSEQAAFLLFHRRWDWWCRHDLFSDWPNLHMCFVCITPEQGVQALPPFLLSEPCSKASSHPHSALRGRGGSERYWRVARGQMQRPQKFWESFPRSACSVAASPLLWSQSERGDEEHARWGICACLCGGGAFVKTAGHHFPRQSQG